MSNPHIFRAERTPTSRSGRRRPTGVSRRQRKKQLGFETLEDRRVMSAQSPLVSLQGAVDESVSINVQSYSSATPEGALQVYLNELYWQSLAESATQANATVAAASLPTDPLVANQWHLINLGQEVGNPDFQDIFGVPGEDINVAPVYNNTGLTGAGVVVAVIDSAFQSNHPDLAANVSSTLGFSTFTGSSGPSAGVFSGAHGTAVAGLIGAVANNGIGGSGVAPGVTLVPIEFLDSFGNGGANPNAAVSAFRYETDQIDITNNSWSPFIDTDGDGLHDRGISNLTVAEVDALRDSIIFGRDGLGVIHVFAAGNDAGSTFNEGFQSIGVFDSANYNGWVNSRYTIGVTGVDHDGFYNNIDGTITSYAETGTSVLIAAPTGSSPTTIGTDSGIGSGMYTTDLTGEAGTNFSPDPITGQEFDRDFLTDIDYTSRFNGTSGATPLVTGVIALMLEANPNLSWRDVQEILVRSARQNAEFEVPEIANQVGGIGLPTQNTWITNQMPVFHDPDAFDRTIPAALQTLFPTLDPTLSPAHFAPTPFVLTNGAGYTVSQGKGVFGEDIGYAHGVIDAELAVQLAQQWHTKNQALPDELTFTSFVSPNGPFFFNLPAAEQTDNTALRQIIPGGLFGLPGFGAYWQEYFADDPFSGTPPPANTRGGAVSVTVPANNAMTVESLEVKFTIAGGNVDALDSVRMLLVSPNGTHHELNDFFIDDSYRIPHSLQNENPATFFTGGPTDLSVDTNPGGNLVVTFSSNRSWGERSDDALIFDPTTAEPVNGLLSQGWTLHMENYSPTTLQVEGIEFVWHGSPIEATTQRLQGLVGVDDGGENGVGARDDSFNFSRINPATLNIDGDSSTLRFGEVVNFVDGDHESMGANVTVFAHRDLNNNGVLDASDPLIDQFVTGADGNYYFDLNPNFDYIISVEDAAGRTAVDDTLTNPGFLKNFQTQWLVTSDFFKVWDYDANLEVPLQAATNAPFSFSGAAIPDHVKHINFLLDPGAPAAPQVDFTGSIFADINGDGIFNRDDVAVPGVGVFGDVNRNGVFDSGEVLATTDANGQYLLTVSVDTTSVINVGVRPPADWTASNPDTGFESFFVQPGDVFAGVDFHIQPPAANNNGDGSNLSGIILGTVFDDRSGDMARQADEFGVPNQTVYLDVNNSGAIDAGDVVTTTNSNGAFVFANVADGSHFLRWEVTPDSGTSQTFPDFDLPQFATITLGGTALGVDFGISSGGVIGGGGAFLDFGDLPDVYGTLIDSDGARHPEGNLFLGSRIDSEADGEPTTDNALGDNIKFLADEDGVVLVGGTLVAGSTGTLSVTASLFGGYLQSWMDFNNDGDFDDTIDGVSEHVVINELLVQGSNTVTFDIPSTLVSSTVFARFRLGEWGLGSTGLAQIGEVEDYVLAVDPGSIPQVVIHGPDFDEDGDVDGSDFLAWQRGAGTSSNATAAQGDANSDGAVNSDDLVILQQDYGQGSSVSQVIATGDFDSDGDTDGADFLAFQRGLGLAASLSSGDGNQDGNVDGSDLQVWTDSYGEVNAAAAFFASQTLSAASSSQQITAASAARGPSLYQPGFREDLVAGVVDTSESNGTIDHQNLASVASVVERLAAHRHRHATPLARQENRGETHQARVEERSEFGLAMRDRVLDQIFAKRHKSLEELVTENGPERHEGLNVEAALAEAFGEEIDWRLG